MDDLFLTDEEKRVLLKLGDDPENIVDVFWTDKEPTSITVDYKEEDGFINRVFIDYDQDTEDDNKLFKKLESMGWNVDKINISTERVMGRFRKTYEKELITLGKKDELLKTPDQWEDFMTLTNITNFLTKEEVDNETLFKFKIESFEYPEFADKATFEEKKEVRQCTNYYDILKIVLEVLKR